MKTDNCDVNRDFVGRIGFFFLQKVERLAEPG